MTFDQYCHLRDRKLEIDRELHVASPMMKNLLKLESQQIEEATLLYDGSYRDSWLYLKAC